MELAGSSGVVFRLAVRLNGHEVAGPVFPSYRAAVASVAAVVRRHAGDAKLHGVVLQRAGRPAQAEWREVESWGPEVVRRILEQQRLAGGETAERKRRENGGRRAGDTESKDSAATRISATIVQGTETGAAGGVLSVPVTTGPAEQVSRPTERPAEPLDRATELTKGADHALNRVDAFSHRAANEVARGVTGTGMVARPTTTLPSNAKPDRAAPVLPDPATPLLRDGTSPRAPEREGSLEEQVGTRPRRARRRPVVRAAWLRIRAALRRTRIRRLWHRLIGKTSGHRWHVAAVLLVGGGAWLGLALVQNGGRVTNLLEGTVAAQPAMPAELPVHAPTTGGARRNLANGQSGRPATTEAAGGRAFALPAPASSPASSSQPADSRRTGADKRPAAAPPTDY